MAFVKRPSRLSWPGSAEAAARNGRPRARSPSTVRAPAGCSARAPAARRQLPTHKCTRARVLPRKLRRATRATKGRRVAAADTRAPQKGTTRAHPIRDTTPITTQEGDGIYTRTNGAGLASLEAGATVSVVGRLTGDSSIETSDGVQINLVEPSEAAQTMMPASGCVEVVGTVRDTGSVSPLRVAAFGDDFDLKNYDDLIGLAGDKYAALFR